MKTLILSTYDTIGGAPRATYRLHKGLEQISVNSQMLVQAKQSDNKTVIGRSASSGMGRIFTGSRLVAEQLPLKLFAPKNNSFYSLQWLPDNIAAKVASLEPDIINVHWFFSYLQIETLAKFNKPIVFTLHDMWAFTGGCYYNQDCDRYKSACGACPQLGSKRDWDLSRWVWQRKAKAWKKLNITVITPSIWLAKCAGESSLFSNTRIEVIPYGLDTNVYKPIDKKIARELLGLPQNKQLILFLSLAATSDRRKGFQLLQPALQKLSQVGWKDRIEVIVVGASKPEKPAEFGFKSHYLGSLNDDLTLALTYSAADVFVAPSIQDNLPNTVMEAISCGTPTVAFKIGGMPDMIEHKQNGYLAEPYEIEDLAQGIAWVLENKERHRMLSHRSREKVEQEFTSEIQANRYLSLYKEILSNVKTVN